ncbi:helix-loop-helix dna-binding domain-containing [Trichoderma cornu-damae]|uniref:Helix-loop-helix dna-binding domain-containing n=1 Tax=Trichoderma cornu-damae TaxID=654480 RepID=A0A9P8QUU8_9HYPO|nr:helix-loop-helix dna-binding domain-containing [Trichoderma cornu-damae]
MSSSPSQTSGLTADAANKNTPSAAAANADDKPRLTEEEKKQNHIASGKYGGGAIFGLTLRVKRRQAIREGFDRLTELVPGLEGQGRSEGLVLKRTVDYMREQLVQRQVLIDRIEQAGGNVNTKYKK